MFQACAARFDVTENLENFLLFRMNKASNMTICRVGNRLIYPGELRHTKQFLWFAHRHRSIAVSDDCAAYGQHEERGDLQVLDSLGAFALIFRGG